MISLPKAFEERIRRDLGDEAAQFLASYSLSPAKGIRVNTLKIDVESFKKISPFALEPVPWAADAFYVDEQKPGKTVLHAAGAYYVQEPSAMCAAPLLDARAGELVLDLCSAPGGKGTQLAQAMRGEGVIVLNEINFQRAKALSSNVERLGITNAVVTCASPDALAQKLGGAFDKVLVDAPCSGEGMFKKEQAAIPEWSVKNVKMCAARQSEILDCAAQLLAPQGSMVYSTCTFSREEDEEQVQSFVERHADMRLVKSFKLYPHKVRGEGHYAALFKKSGSDGASIAFMSPHADKKSLSLFGEFCSKYLNVSYKNIHAVGGRLYSLPDNCPAVGVQTLRAGVELGEVVKGRFEPSHSLAMCLKAGQAAFIALDEQGALSYLRGNTFACDENASGWAVASYLGFPLGWCKLTHGIAKNHLPKALRITN